MILDFSCLGWPLAGSISFDEKIIEGDSIRNYGGKDKCNNPNLIFWQGSLDGANLSVLNWIPIELESLTPFWDTFKEVNFLSANFGDREKK